MAKADKYYEKNKKIIGSTARAFATRHDVDYDEMVSVGNTGFMAALKKWSNLPQNKRRCSFRTYLYTFLWKLFLEYTRRQDRPRPFHEERHGNSTSVNPAMELDWKDRLQDLSEEAKHVCHMLITGAAEAMGVLGTEMPKMNRGHIQRYLVTKRGLTHRKSWAVLRELKEVVR